MSSLEHSDPRPAPAGDPVVLRRAWIAVALIPVFFLPALALGYVMYDLFGYAPENADAPLWVDVVCAIPPLALYLAPCVAAVVLGRRADRHGDRRGLVPLAIGAIAGLALTVLTVVTLING